MIVIVDDERAVLDTLARTLARRGHDTRCFDNAADALEAVTTLVPQLVLTDIRMPVHDGVWLLNEISVSRPNTGVMVMTAAGEIKTAVECIRGGAIDFLAKPFGTDELYLAVDRALDKLALRQENQAHRVLLEARKRELERTVEQLNEMFLGSMLMLIRALDFRERETRNHSCRVAMYAAALAQAMSMDSDFVRKLLLGGLIHDIGKIGLPDSILLKPGPLNPCEQEIMRKHPEIGFDIVRQAVYPLEASDVVLCHHERYDARGYPRGLKGDEIPLSARIFSIADAMDAITSDRPYRPAQPFTMAQEEICRGAGSQFDPEIASAFGAVSAAQWEEIRTDAHLKVWTHLGMDGLGFEDALQLRQFIPLSELPVVV